MKIDTIKGTKKAYYGSEALIKEFFGEEEKRSFRMSVTPVGILVGPTIDYERELQDYKDHITDCISHLKVYRERIIKFWPNEVDAISGQSTLNYKLIGTKFGESLKYETSINEINRTFTALADFGVDSYSNPSITSSRSQLIYDWVMTIGNSKHTENEKTKILEQGITTLTHDNILGSIGYFPPKAGPSYAPVQLKDNAAISWCSTATELSGETWEYAKVGQKEFEELHPESFEELVKVVQAPAVENE